MKAAGLDYEGRRPALFETPEPEPPQPGEVLFRVHEVGICGTDRELANFHFGFPPAGQTRLVLGHEALGEVIAVGAGVEAIRPGDWVVPAVRRACSPACPSCARGRRDLCLTGKSPERGIFGLHGYLTEYAVDQAADLVRIPGTLSGAGVLIEPLSVVEKAIATALRLHVSEPRTALVLGAGPIGILAALVLQLRGLQVAVFSLEPADHPRAQLVRAAGLRYATSVDGEQADILIEATGSADAAFAGFSALAPLGVYGILGSQNAQGYVPFINMLVKNQMIFGSVNASPEAFQNAAADLGRLDAPVLQRMLTRLSLTSFPEVVGDQPGGVKTVLRMA